MLSSTKTYHVKIRPGKYQGYEVIVQQLCFIFWYFKFWDTVRIKECTTAYHVGQFITHLEARFGKMEIIYSNVIPYENID